MKLGSDWSRIGQTICAAAGILTLQATAHADPGGTVVTENGPVKGVVLQDSRQYLGIPYAAPPTGALRWQPPQAAAKWKGQLDASHFANHCPQPATQFGLASQNEDCLYLNVFAPPKHADKKGSAPVMVWFHPGAFQYGESDDFDPSDMVGDGVVVVTVNYRLGALGFMAHPALTAESSSGSSGNYGLQDQQAALGWVKRNIDRFGGDPSQVTIAGQSAGAASVHAHMASPMSAGLFQRAIAQSGGYALSLPTLATAEAQGKTYATAVGCSSQDAACLRAVPVSTLLANQSTDPTAYLPKVDGAILPLSIGTAFATGQFNRVPVIEGSTHDEFSLFVAALFELKGIPVIPQTYTALISAMLSVPASTAQTLATFVYPLSAYPNTGAALTAVGTDAAFACNTRVAARLLGQYVPTWAYEFSDASAPMIYLPPVSFSYNAYHGSELQYLFDVRESVPAPALNPTQLQLASQMRAYWTQFAKNADPNGAGTPAWANFVPNTSDSFQSFSGSSAQPITGAAFGAAHKCAVWGSP